MSELLRMVQSVLAGLCGCGGGGDRSAGDEQYVGLSHNRVVTDWRGGVDGWWAEVLHLPVGAVRSGGVFALDHVDHAGVVAVPDRGPLVYGPPATRPALSAAARMETGALLQLFVERANATGAA